jgi:hypothetical protein
VSEETHERLLLGRPVSVHRFEPMTLRYEGLLQLVNMVLSNGYAYTPLHKPSLAFSLLLHRAFVMMISFIPTHAHTLLYTLKTPVHINI